jgi:L-lactate utilization protein LutC
VERVCEVAVRAGARRAIRWAHPLLDRLRLDGALRERGVEVVRWTEVEQMAARDPEGARDLVFRADLGISGVDAAAAETGTLALASLPGQGRSVSLLPPVHVALVESCQVVPDLFDLLARVGRDPNGLPGNVALITGPSKTGDIELRLTTGVHGPGEVHVIILERDVL